MPVSLEVALFVCVSVPPILLFFIVFLFIVFVVFLGIGIYIFLYSFLSGIFHLLVFHVFVKVFFFFFLVSVIISANLETFSGLPYHTAHIQNI